LPRVQRQTRCQWEDVKVAWLQARARTRVASGHISKMGNRQLRKLLVVGAHAALYSMKNGCRFYFPVSIEALR